MHRGLRAPTSGPRAEIDVPRRITPMPKILRCRADSFPGRGAGRATLLNGRIEVERETGFEPATFSLEG